jgi:hypothetical protein
MLVACAGFAFDDRGEPNLKASTETGDSSPSRPDEHITDAMKGRGLRSP